MSCQAMSSLCAHGAVELDSARIACGHVFLLATNRHIEAFQDSSGHSGPEFVMICDDQSEYQRQASGSLGMQRSVQHLHIIIANMQNMCSNPSRKAWLAVRGLAFSCQLLGWPDACTAAANLRQTVRTMRDALTVARPLVPRP